MNLGVFIDVTGGFGLFLTRFSGAKPKEGGEWSPRAAEEPLARAATAEESVADARGEFANAHSPPVSEQRVKGHELR